MLLYYAWEVPGFFIMPPMPGVSLDCNNLLALGVNYKSWLFFTPERIGDLSSSPLFMEKLCPSPCFVGTSIDIFIILEACLFCCLTKYLFKFSWSSSNLRFSVCLSVSHY